MANLSIDQVLKENAPSLMAMEGVVGTAQGEWDGEPCILVMVAARSPELNRTLPKRIEGYRVEVRVTGEFRAVNDEETDRSSD